MWNLACNRPFHWKDFFIRTLLTNAYDVSSRCHKQLRPIYKRRFGKLWMATDCEKMLQKYADKLWIGTPEEVVREAKTTWRRSLQKKKSRWMRKIMERTKDPIKNKNKLKCFFEALCSGGRYRKWWSVKESSLLSCTKMNKVWHWNGRVVHKITITWIYFSPAWKLVCGLATTTENWYLNLNHFTSLKWIRY